MTPVLILTHDQRWARLRPVLRRAIEAVLASQKITRSSLCVVLTDDDEIARLNHQYRGKKKPTNVLSFPDGHTEDGVKHLGDLILSYDTLRQEARMQKKTLPSHAMHLAVHGTLHLLGFDHETDEDASIMEACETALLIGMGVANPYDSD